MNKPNRLIYFGREASSGGQTLLRSKELEDAVAGSQNNIYSLNKLANQVTAQEQAQSRNNLVQSAANQGVQLTPNAQGGATAVMNGKTYNLQGASEGGKPFVPSNPVNASILQPARTKTVASNPNAPSATNPMVQISPRGANTPAPATTAPVYKTNYESLATPPALTPKTGYSNYSSLAQSPSLTAEDFLKMTPDQQMAYRQYGFQQNAQNQIEGLNQAFGGMGQIYDQRAAGIQSEIEKLQAQKDQPQLSEQEKLAIDELNAQKAKALELQKQAAERSSENINESLAFSGFGRSTKRADLLADNQTNLDTAIADISRKYAEGEASIRANALERGNKEIERLQARLDKTQDMQDQLALDKFSKAFTLQQELFKQDPSNPENMIKVAEQLQTTRLAEARLKFDEEKAARQDARQNFQWQISNFGSQAFANLPDEYLVNMASNLGMPVSAIKNMGKTLQEQENEWEQLKYQVDRQDKFDLQANSQQFQAAMNDLNFKQDLQKLGINFNLDVKKLQLGEQFKSEADERKWGGLSYGSYASNAVDVQPQTGGLVMETGAVVQPKLKDAYPNGYKKSADSIAGGLGGQCAAEAGRMVSPPNGKGNMVYGMDMKAKKANLAKYVQQGQAFNGWNGTPQVGFSIISNDSPKWGHVSVVNEVRPDGSVVVSEFNRKGALTFTNNRVIPAGDKSVIGFIKTKPQPKYAVPTDANKVMETIKKDPIANTASTVLGMTSFGKMMGAIGQNLPQAVTNQANKEAMQRDSMDYLPDPAQMDADYEAGLIDEQGLEITPERAAVRNGSYKLDQDTLTQLRRRNPQAYTQYMQDLAVASNPTKSTPQRLPADKVVMLEDAKFLPGVLDNLEKTINSDSAAYDPVWGRARSMNPFDGGQQMAEAETRTAAQLIGKYMEGGVLRAEDEVKYRNMLPNTADTKEVALAKLAQIRTMLDQKTQGYISGFQNAGYDMSGYQQPAQVNSMAGGGDSLSLGLGGGGQMDSLGLGI